MSSRQPQTSTGTVSMAEPANGDIVDDIVRLAKRRKMINTDVTGINLGLKKTNSKNQIKTTKLTFLPNVRSNLTIHLLDTPFAIW